MSRRPMVGQPNPGRGGDGRRLMWSESPVPRVATRRVRMVGAPQGSPVECLFVVDVWLVDAFYSEDAPDYGYLPGGYFQMYLGSDAPGGPSAISERVYWEPPGWDVGDGVSFLFTGEEYDQVTRESGPFDWATVTWNYGDGSAGLAMTEGDYCCNQSTGPWSLLMPAPGNAYRLVNDPSGQIDPGAL